MNWFVKTFEELDVKTLYDIIALRFDVFIIEQACFYQEIDYKDFKALHVYTRDDYGKIIAYLRILEPGVSFEEVSIGRVVVALRVRGEGYGRALMLKGLSATSEHYGNVPIRISAQAYLKKFYTSLGFIPTSEIYLEDDIPHIDMLLEP